MAYKESLMSINIGIIRKCEALIITNEASPKTDKYRLLVSGYWFLATQRESLEFNDFRREN